MSPNIHSSTQQSQIDRPCAANQYGMSADEYIRAVEFTDGWFAARLEYAGH